jgi:polysaccharide biosynthesis/export protein
MKNTVMMLMLLLSIGTLHAQQAGPSGESAQSAAMESEQLRLAISSEDYPVTPGDVYQLVYQQGNVTMTAALLVEGDYSVNLGLFGKMSTSGMTFDGFKQLVEDRIANAYPRSMPSLTITALGLFRVQVTGETNEARSVTAWGLSHVSDVTKNLLRASTSLRNVQLISRGGKSKTFDLFKAIRNGQASEDPLVKAGDTIVLSRCARSIELAGEVYRPGTYEMLPGEQLQALIEVYGDGVTSKADASRIRIQRTSGGRQKIQYFDLSGKTTTDTDVEGGDVVTVPLASTSQPTVIFEGGIIPPGISLTSSVSATILAQNNRIIHPFIEGETLSDALRAINENVAPQADLSSAYIVRVGRADPLPVNIQALMAAPSQYPDVLLQANDRIVIPLLRYAVYVSGAVASPGSYAYTPGRLYSYYVTMAGGSMQEAPGLVTVTDAKGNARALQAAIQPEDRINIPTAFIYVMGSVFVPGRFPFMNGQPSTYYVAMAGGVDPEQNANGRVRVTDVQGRTRKAGEPLQPGDTVFAPGNNLLYNLSRYSGLLGLIATFVATTITVLTYLR